MSPSPDPRVVQVRRALGRLCTRGLLRYWIRSRAGPLLDLRCVQERATKLLNSPGSPIDLNDSDGGPEALIEILREQVGGMRRSQVEKEEGKLLWIVLGLDPRFADKSAWVRREAAGREFRGGEATVLAGTIRQLHEPRALDALTSRLLTYEDGR
ncbi:MAG TPA: hypothetical protein VKB03_15710 [Conexibacter sp.]|nr:hypothetical protein [Conexibacter sp.]